MRLGALRTLWRMLDARERRRLVGLQVLGLIMALSTFIGVASLAPFLLVLSDPQALERYAPLVRLRELLGPATHRELALLLGAGFVGVFALTNAINLGGTLEMQRFSMRVGDRLHAALLAEYLHRDYRFHAHHGVENVFNRVVFWVNRITYGVLDSFISLTSNAMVLVVVFASVVWMSPWLALWALVWLGGGYALLYSTLRRRLVRIGAREAEQIDARTRLAMDGLCGVKEVMLLHRQSHFVESFAASCAGISRQIMRMQTFSQVPRYALEAMTIVGLVGAALFVSAGNVASVWIAQMAFLGFAAYRLLPSAQQMFASFVRIRANRVYFEQVAADLACASARAPGQQPVAAFTPRVAIELDAVSFRYAPGDALALRDLSLRIPVGSMVAITGRNGCGKTTLIDLIAGLSEPDSGRVLVDGRVLDACNRAAWHEQIAYVPQQMYLFEGTLAQNVAFGAADGTSIARASSRLRGSRVSRSSSGVCRPGSTNPWAAARAGSASENGSASRSRARYIAMRRYCCSTRSRARSTSLPSRRSLRTCARCAVPKL